MSTFDDGGKKPNSKATARDDARPSGEVPATTHGGSRSVSRQVSRKAEPIGGGRRAAAKQINRSMSAWRETMGDTSMATPVHRKATDEGDDKADAASAEQGGSDEQAATQAGGEQAEGEAGGASAGDDAPGGATADGAAADGAAKPAAEGEGEAEGEGDEAEEKPVARKVHRSALETLRSVIHRAQKVHRAESTDALTSPSGKPAKEGEVQMGGAPTLQMWGYGGVRKVNGVLVKDMEKEVADLTAKQTTPAGLKPEERLKLTQNKATLDDIKKTKEADYLIFAGHIGISMDGGATIYGFTPVAPEGMPREQVIGHLHNHTMTFPGQVANDKSHFDLATRCAADKKWDTDVVTVDRPVTTATHAETKKKLQDMAGMQPGAHGLYYSFPLAEAQPGQYFVDTPGPDGKIVKGQDQANCATFPGKIGIELPEQSGNLRFFMKNLRAQAAGGARSP